ncbi:hypothetical protein PsYK624_039340 [Phanerochaete sordida]|uniref:Uncharacterized protein n=1 Tax=Phanerochaete sordida TaxID=48140 RepID=A0A9P3LA66_9APHY|nr:hypothetical protein PsYK624_039340 [Phanerochaete sordida]
MWCTRWYLPLVLLPLPIAPPYFLLLFLLSTTLHARPCFYCIMLLTAMFMASCYWPPVSLDEPLSRPWSDNITTFGEALTSRIPDLPAELMPATIPIVDRCWCDLSMGFFEPFNSTRWEWNSVEKVKTELEQRLAGRGESDSQSLREEAGDRESEGPAQLHTAGGYSVLSGAASTLAAMQRKLGLARASDAAANSTATAALDTLTSTPPPIVFSAHTTANDTFAGETTLFREYDLRPYGFDMIVDLSWPRWP